MRFIDRRVLDIADDKISSNFLAYNCKATYAYYIRVFKMMSKEEAVLDLL